MTAARIRSALAPILKTLGFSRSGSRLALSKPELEHSVSVFAVRRLTGYFEVVHTVAERTVASSRDAMRDPLLQGHIQGFMEPYLGLWALDRFDAELAAKQIAEIAAAFGSLSDVAHFYSDRPTPYSPSTLHPPSPVGAPNSLNSAEEKAQLRLHSKAIFSEHFDHAPRLGEEIWAHREQVGGFRYCAYLAATNTATFASLLYFPLSSTDIENGRKSDRALKALFGAPKRLLYDEGEPVLIPLRHEVADHAQVASVLLHTLALDPPNALPRR